MVQRLHEALSLTDALDELHARPMTVRHVPFLVRLVENPRYKLLGRNLFLFPGAMDLCDHDLIHILLGKGFTERDEIYVIGFTMGSSQKMRFVNTALYWCIARHIYRPPYRVQSRHFSWFRVGIKHGEQFGRADLSMLKVNSYAAWTVGQLRKTFMDEQYVSRYISSKA